MVQVNERVEGCYELRDIPVGAVRQRSPERVVLECGCRARVILVVGQAIVRQPLECGVCGESFVRSDIRFP